MKLKMTYHAIATSKGWLNVSAKKATQKKTTNIIK